MRKQPFNKRNTQIIFTHLAEGGGGQLHLVRNVTGRHPLEQLGEEAVCILKALHKLRLTLCVVTLLVLLSAQLAPAEVVNEVDLHSQEHAYVTKTSHVCAHMRLKKLRMKYRALKP